MLQYMRKHPQKQQWNGLGSVDVIFMDFHLQVKEGCHNKLRGVITTQIVLFYTLINIGFDHFLYSNRLN